MFYNKYPYINDYFNKKEFMITVIITLIVVGVVMWLINYIPMQPTIKRILNIVVVIIVVVWLLKVFGLWAYLTNINV
jgi:hypothetical protein